MATAVLAPEAAQDVLVTPHFEFIEVEDVPQSEIKGYKVMKTLEVVRVQIAGDRNYSPVFPVEAQAYKRQGRVVSYAERWADQYAQFKGGTDQTVDGTPMDVLMRFGVTQSDISLCRALKIYTVEQMARLEGDQLKNLGMIQNKMKEAARKFHSETMSNDSALSEIDALKAEIAALKAAGANKVPEVEATPEEIDELVEASDEAYADMTDAQIKDRIKELTGQAPRGNPSRDTLVRMLEAA